MKAKKGDKEVNKAMRKGGGYVRGTRLKSGINGFNATPLNLMRGLVTAIFVISVLAMFTAVASADTLNVNQTGWWRDGGTFNASSTPIQHAIDNATAGDTINVADGTYTITAAINVNKQDVTITGNITNPGNVLVKYNPASDTLNCVEVTSADVTIQGIKVQDCKNGFHFDRNVNTNTGVTISNCIIESVSGWGIGEISSPNTVISNNTITTAGDKGIYIRKCEGTSESNRCEVISNVISGCGDPAIQTYFSKYTYVYDNTISSTNDKGINIIKSGATGTADRVQVIGNTISETKWPGIQVIGAPYTYVYDNTLTQCNYYGADDTGDWDYASIHVANDIGPTYSHYTVIDNNTISDGINGVQIWSNNCTVTNNTIYDMGLTYNDTKGTAGVGDGVYYNSGIIVGSNWLTNNNKPTGTTITNNNIHDNYWGLYVRNYTALSPGDPSVLSVTAEKNWWGHATGPGGQGPGTGDDVSTNVDYSPWLGYTVGTSPMTWHTNDNIQDAIDAANPGDTIIVEPGTYLEWTGAVSAGVAVDIPWFAEGAGGLTIQSTAGAANTIIDCGSAGSGVKINSNGITFDGFTVKNAYTAVGQVSAKNHTLRNLIITDFGIEGLELANVHNCTFSNITIHGNNGSLPYGTGGGTCGDGGTVKGIDMQEYGSGGNSDNTFEDITIYDIETTGTGSTYGIYWEGDKQAIHPTIDNTFTNVTIHDMTGPGWEVGIYMIGKDTPGDNLPGIEYATFSGGNIYNCKYAIYVQDGCSDVSISGFDFTNIDYNVIRFEGGGTGLMSNITITENACLSTTIYTAISVADTGSSIITISNNDVRNNGNGIGIFGSTDATFVTAHYNNIEGNTGYGVKNLGIGTLDAKYNWWGDVSGPSGSGYGTGDTISDNVYYDPWLDAPCPGGQPIYFTGAQTNTTASTGTTEINATAETNSSITINTNAAVNVTIAAYSHNPGTGLGGGINKHIDVHIDNPAGVNNMTITLFYTAADIVGIDENILRMRWWDGDSWVRCSNTSVNTTDQGSYSGYIWAYIDNTTTTPMLWQLTGSGFGAGSPVDVTIQSTAALPGENNTVLIIADDGGNHSDNMSLAQSTINVSFNSSVVHVTGVATGSGNALTVWSSNIQNGAGWVKIASSDGSAAHNGTVTLAVLTLEAVGPDTVNPSVTNPIANVTHAFSAIHQATILNDVSPFRARPPGANVSQLNVTVVDRGELTSALNIIEASLVNWSYGDIANTPANGTFTQNSSGVSTVTVNLSVLNGSATQTMTRFSGSDIWSVTTNASAGINNTNNLVFNATDNSSNSNTSAHVDLTVLRRGDVVRNNIVDGTDLLRIAKYITGKEPTIDEFIAGVWPANVYDGFVNGKDMLYIAKYVVGTETAP